MFLFWCCVAVNQLMVMLEQINGQQATVAAS